MRHLLLLLCVVGVLVADLGCQEEKPEVSSPEPPAAGALETPAGQPTTALPSPHPTVAATVEPEPTWIPWSEAINHIGEWATVCGGVPYANYLSDRRGQPTFIVIGKSYLDPEHFTIVIWGEDRDNFSTPPEDAYLTETVCVAGWIEPYGEAAQVTVSSPADIVTVATPGVLPGKSPPAASPTPPDFGPFAKDWGRHGFGITVATTGEATASWRVYKLCNDDPTPPCDPVVNNDILNGGHVTIIFTRVVGDSAYGWVKESTDEQGFSGRIALTLQPYDMALLESVDGPEASSTLLCGPNFWEEAPESLQQEWPCGA